MFSLTEPNVGKNYCLRSTKFEDSNISLLDNIHKIIYELNFLTQQYARTNVVFVSDDYVVVPDEIYEPKQKTELFQFSSLHKDHLFVLVDHLEKYKANVIYDVNPDVYDFLLRSLYNPQFYHHTSSLINIFEGKKKTVGLYSRFYVNIDDNRLDFICFKGDKLCLCQSHEDLTPSEQIYFILKIWESLEFDQNKDQLLIAGGDLDDKVLDVLREYIRIIEPVASPSEIYLWHKDAQKAPLDLIALSL